jgi:DNA-binding ferritin-like protein
MEKNGNPSGNKHESMAAYARLLVGKHGKINYNVIHKLNKYMSNKGVKISAKQIEGSKKPMKTKKEAVAESAKIDREELKQILKEDMAYCSAISKKVTNGSDGILKEDQMVTLASQPRWAPLMKEYGKRLAELNEVKKFLVEEAEAEQAQADADPALMLMCVLKARYEDFKIYHHMLAGGNWLQDHELLGKYYDEVAGMSDAIIELLMQYGRVEPTWTEVLQNVDTVTEVTAVDADYAFYKVREGFGEIIHWIRATRDDESLGLSDGAKSELDAKAYELELECQYKLSRRLAEVDAEVNDGGEDASDEADGQGEDDAQADEEAQAEAQAPVDEQTAAKAAPAAK